MNFKNLNINIGSKAIFFIKFLVISTVLFLIYIPLSNIIFSITISTTNVIMSLFGYGMLNLSIEKNADLSDVLINLNILAYAALILATPKIETITTFKKVSFLLSGIIFLFLMNATLIASDTIFSYTGGTSVIAYLCIMFFGTYGQVFFPFVFWFFMAKKWIFKD